MIRLTRRNKTSLIGLAAEKNFFSKKNFMAYEDDILNPFASEDDDKEGDITEDPEEEDLEELE